MTVEKFILEMNSLMNIEKFSSLDISLNGLQVGHKDKEIKKMAFAVDACQATIDEAAKRGADLLFVHHGLFWGKPVAITGSHYSRVKKLLESDMALFACHLPLDAHCELGNNARMAQVLGLEEVEPFSLYKGEAIGCKGTLPNSLSCDEIIKKLGIREDSHNTVINGGKAKNMTVGIVSGSAASDVEDAIREGLDCYITGESSHSCYHTCLEEKINMLCLGHYETETFGVKAVMDYVKRSFNIETTFVDIPTRL